MPTLTDGREVASDSEEWRLECLARHRHVETLQSLAGREARAAYVERVRHAEGDEAANRLKAAFLVAWQARNPTPG